MVFLILQMALLLIIAVSIGTILGWWLNKLKTKKALADAAPTVEATQGRELVLKNQLDKCFDDNVVLRRELKFAQSHQVTEEDDSPEQPNREELQEKINVLMDDLQMREDTVVSLTQELKQLQKRSNNNP